MNATVKELNDALNLIGKYCQENLPAGWKIQICVNKDEMIVSLEDPDCVEVDNFEGYESNVIIDACDFAKNEEEGFNP